MHLDDSRILHLVLVHGLAPERRLATRTALERAAFQVEEVKTDEELELLCNELGPDLVLLGEQVGAARAIEICRKLRAHAACTHVPIVCHAADDECASVLDAGALDCVAPGAGPVVLAHRARTAVRSSQAMFEEARHRTLLDVSQRAARIGTFELLPDRHRIRLSTQASRLFGVSPEVGEAIARSAFLDLVQPAQRPTVRAWIEQASHAASDEPIEFPIAAPDGKERFLRFEPAGARLVTVHGRSIAGVVRDVSQEREAQDRVRLLLSLGGSTGLADRQRFLERLSDVLAQAQPPRDKSAVIVLHLDLAGALPPEADDDARDAFVGLLAARVKECTRERDVLGVSGSTLRDVTLARIGMEELVVLLPALAQSQDAHKVARRIQDALREPVDLLRGDVPVSVAIGIALAPADATSAEPLLTAAEAALQVAREEERAGIRFFTSSMNATAVERRALESSLRNAIERGELAVHYQPRVEIASGKIVSFEALVRWKHPELGMVSPAQFIPIAEETGLIIPLGEHVLSVACAQNKRWQDEGRPPVRVAVNLSSVQFMDNELEARARRVLAATGLAPEWLELELTESILLHRVDTTIATLEHLKAMGVHLSIDDFGTGYSSLSYLKRFPIDALKIDQSFIRDVTTNPDDASITTSIILMGKSLKLRVVAEGVETRSQLAFLRVLECDEAQGYLFSRPLPGDEAGALLSKGLSADLVGL